MIEQEYFLGFPFPWLLRSTTGLHIASGDGALFPLSTKIHVEKELNYLMTATPGWTISPSGYAAYVTTLSSDERIYLAVYGLKIAGITSSRGRENRLSIKLERQDFEKFIKKSIEALRQSKEKLNSVMRANIHEVRSINADIYNSAYRLRENFELSSYIEERDYPIVRNIEELSKILRTRTDVLDVLSNPALLQAPKGSIPIYRAFHRVVLSLDSTALAGRVQLKMSGSSVGRVSGSTLFDVIPYLLIQNAIKYAPRESIVQVEFSEDVFYVEVTISSKGPVVEDDEAERIFMLGFRGRNAQHVTTEGTGFGLYLVRMLVESHQGASIRFTQGPDREMINGISYSATYVTIKMTLQN